MIDVYLQNAWIYCINKEEDDKSLSLLAFRRDDVNVIFLKYSKEDRSSLSHAGIRNVPKDVCYDDTKHYQVSSEKRGRFKVCKKNFQRCCE